jgi:hypothetical protein
MTPRDKATAEFRKLICDPVLIDTLSRHGFELNYELIAEYLALDAVQPDHVIEEAP